MGVNPSGRASSAAFNSSSVSRGTADSRAGLPLGECSSWGWRAALSMPSSTRPSSSITRCTGASASSFETTPSATSFSASTARAVGWPLMRSYITGWVKSGSSPSLCPQRR